MEDIMNKRLYCYGLMMVKRDDRHYFMVDMESGDCFEDMSLYYIMELIGNWSKNKF